MTIASALGAELPLLNHKGEKVAVSSLEGKHVALFFGGTWCPHCRKFGL